MSGCTGLKEKKIVKKSSFKIDLKPKMLFKTRSSVCSFDTWHKVRLPGNYKQKIYVSLQ